MGYVFNILVVMMISINFIAMVKDDSKICCRYVKRDCKRRQARIKQYIWIKSKPKKIKNIIYSVWDTKN